MVQRYCTLHGPVMLCLSPDVGKHNTNVVVAVLLGHAAHIRAPGRSADVGAGAGARTGVGAECRTIMFHRAPMSRVHRLPEGGQPVVTPVAACAHAILVLLNSTPSLFLPLPSEEKSTG